MTYCDPKTAKAPQPPVKRHEAPNRLPSRSARASERGAALIVAIGVLTFLLAASVVLFQMSRQEMQAATNVSNQARADLMKDGALALAVAFLNHDAVVHPTFTSLDHAWKTYFNGAWVAGAFDDTGTFVPGKPWAMANGTPIEFGGVPAVPQSVLVAANTQFATNAGLGQLPQDFDWIYIPRVSPTPIPFSLRGDDPITLANNGYIFNLPTDVRIGDTGGPNDIVTRAEIIDTWADVDNDGDGYKDSVWLPIPADRLFPEDGLDNDLDGYIDAFDRDGEPGIFLYRGNTNGVDDNGDGIIDDDAEEFLVFQTVQVPFGVLNAQGQLFPVNLSNADLVKAGVRPGLDSYIAAGDTLDNDNTLVVNDGSDVSNYPNAWYRQYFKGQLAADWPEPNLYTSLATMHENASSATFFLNPLLATARIYAEPVTTIVGRMAILITDESSKVHIGEAGRMTYEEYPNLDGSVPVYDGVAIKRAIRDGVAPGEYELGALADNPNVAGGQGAISAGRARRLSSFVMGGNTEFGTISVRDVNESIDPVEFNLLSVLSRSPYAMDMTFPGYGRVDDDGNALALAMNGIDDDGDGLIDEGINIFDTQGNISAQLVSLLGLFEGVDEPGEYRAFRPYRNYIAEGDTAGDVNDPDNDLDGVINEIGELGDRTYQTREQFKLPFQFEVNFNNFFSAQNLTDLYGFNKNRITIYSSDKNNRYAVRSAFGPIEPQFQAVSGLKLDYNIASPDVMLSAFKQDFGYDIRQELDALGDPVVRPLPTTNIFGGALTPAASGSVAPDLPGDIRQAWALGLRQSGMTTIVPPASPGIFFDATPGENRGLYSFQPASVSIPEDDELKAMQMALNIKDSRDSDHARTTMTTRVEDEWYTGMQLANGFALDDLVPRDIVYTVAGVEDIRINEIMVRPVRRVEAEMDVATVNLNPSPLTGMPQFNVLRRTILDTDIAPPVPLVRWDTSGVQFLGDRAHVILDDAPSLLALNTGATDVPDVVEFRFGPSGVVTPELEGLPSGRYYLMIDTRDENGTPTVKVGEEGRLRYAIKYGPYDIATDPDYGAGSILSDVVAGTIDITDPAYNGNSIIVGVDGLGNETGFVFLPAAENISPLVGNGYYDGVPAGVVVDGLDFTPRGTVYIPSLASLGNPQQYLYVAIWKDAATRPTDPLCINFLDFSQEPDHEWVELVNIAKDGPPVNVSGWELEVYALSETDRRTMRIPDGTWIAPGGTLLLGANKFDDYVNATGPLHPQENLIYGNGMGLARGQVTFGGVVAPSYESVTVPPIGEFDALTGQYVSVFNPGNQQDYIDDYGSGVRGTSSGAPEGRLASTSDPYGGAGNDPTITDKAWDRIVELEIDDIANTISIDGVARLVLGGGIFPNYPEFDGIDSDGDGEIIGTDSVDNNGNSILLYDNNLDDDLDGVIDDAGEGTDGVGEGVDEGRFRRTSSRYPLVPDYPLKDRYPGSFSRNVVDYVAQNSQVSLIQVFDETNAPPYLPGAVDPPDWKEFVERRFHAMDNVIVTLYEGPASSGHVVDRITYVQKDIENRAIDDIVSCPYGFIFNSVATPGFVETIYPTLDQRENSPFWPDNTMAFDFYKSLERRHPLYAGDRFGTTNRWEATDGNYDDWAPATSRFERLIGTLGNVLFSGGVPALGFRVGDSRFDHCFSGSPLRMNLAQRLMENPGGQFSPESPNFVLPSTTRQWAFDRADVRNREFTSVGDLARVPRFAITQTLSVNMGTRATSTDTAQRAYEVNYALQRTVNDLQRFNINQTEILLGQANADDLHGVMEAGSFSSQTLSVATAEFEPIAPVAGGGVVLADALGWDTAPPSAWAPVFLFELNDPNSTPDYPFERQYLFDSDYLFGPSASAGRRTAFLGGDQGAAPDGPDATDMSRRWPLERRAAFYASAVPAGETYFPEALFTWDIDDGIENGEYDVYVVVAESLDPLRDQLGDGLRPGGAINESNDLLTGFARNVLLGRYIPPHRNERMADLRLDLECFSNRQEGDNDLILGVDPLAPNNPNRSDRGDSFGSLPSQTPDDTGIIHYGVVRVRDNFLALRVVNRSEPGRMMRLSRVILTPRDRTRGRINLNTVITSVLDNDPTVTADPALSKIYNPLAGIPGVLGDMDFGTNQQLFYAEGLNSIGQPFESDVASTLVAVPSFVQQANTVTNPTIAVFSAQVYDRALRVTASRTAHADGRYYDFASELVRQRNGLNAGILADAEPLATAGDYFDQAITRYSRMANLVTTRSDVFEIIVTVQAGSVIDENSDGIANYRDNTEFTATSEQRARMVYER